MKNLVLNIMIVDEEKMNSKYFASNIQKSSSKTPFTFHLDDNFKIEVPLKNIWE